MASGASESSISASAIPPISTADAVQLEEAELDRVLDALRAVPPDSWSTHLPHSDRNVHAMAAHIAGGYAAQATLSELRRQADPWVLRFYRAHGESLAQTLVRIQIGDRLTRTPTQLIDEIDRAGHRALANRTRVFRPVSAIIGSFAGTPLGRQIPLGPFSATRDLWFHRLELADVIRLPMHLSDDHDAIILAQLVRASSAQANRHLGERAVKLTISGPAGGSWRFGSRDAEPAAQIETDPLAFAKLHAGWRSAAATRERSTIAGDVKLAMIVLRALHPRGK